MSAYPSPLSPLTPAGAAAPATVVAGAGQPRVWSTPRAMRAFRLLVWVLVGLLLLLGESTLAQSRRAFKVIGKDTVPSIIAAQQIGYALADLDANVANSLLGSARHRAQATAAIEKQRLRVTDGLVDAAQNITYGDAEKVPIRAMMRDLGLYLERAAEARLRFEQGDGAGARNAYWAATDLLHTNLLVEAGDLDSANRVELDAAYRLGRVETEGAEVVAIGLGGLLGVALLALQIYLFRRVRRVFNAPLVVATALAMVLPLFLALRFVAARESLRIAKEDAFDSIHSLVRARATAFDVNGDESRYLLDFPATHGFEPVFRKKVATLTTDPVGAPPSRADLEARKKRARSGSKPSPAGLLWDELDNVTFEGEYGAAFQMMQGFRDYMLIDARIRKLAVAGKMDDAVELCIGDRADESNAAFDRFDGALGRTLDINRAAFDHEMDETNRSLGVAETTSIVLAGLIAALTWLGLRPRLREYAV